MPYKFSLLYLFINLIFHTLFLISCKLGMVKSIIDGDITYLSRIMLLCFIIFSIYGFYRVFESDRKSEDLKRMDEDIEFAVSEDLSRYDEHKDILRISNFNVTSGLFVYTGLIGTIIGFVYTLENIDLSLTSDVNNIPVMISYLFTGLFISLHTTLTGSILGLMSTINSQILYNSLSTRIDFNNKKFQR